MSDHDEVVKIRRLAITAMARDPDLLEQLVLKGGNSLDLVYQISPRSSLDLDYSLSSEWSPSELPGVSLRIQKSIESVFAENGYFALDYNLSCRPPRVSEDMEAIWGGYQIQFKLIRRASLDKIKIMSAESLRRNAVPVGANRSTVFKIDVSRHEVCSHKVPKVVDGCRVFVYSQDMLVAEKLRAICQQMPEYDECVTNPSRSPRARDFFDLHTLLVRRNVDVSSDDFCGLVKAVFRAKRVPLQFIGLVSEYRDYHREGFESVKHVLKPGELIESFDYYFDYVLSELCRPLQSLWEE